MAGRGIRTSPVQSLYWAWDLSVLRGRRLPRPEEHANLHTAQDQMKSVRIKKSWEEVTFLSTPYPTIPHASLYSHEPNPLVFLCTMLPSPPIPIITKIQIWYKVPCLCVRFYQNWDLCISFSWTCNGHIIHRKAVLVYIYALCICSTTNENK